MQATQYSLVADIGGTNARFAMVADATAKAIEPRNLRCAEYETIVDATLAYLDLVALGKPYQAAISIASPVTGDALNMMNHSWSFSVNETREALGLRHLKVLNDYTALALALPGLRDEQRLQVGAGQGLAGHPIAVLGPGTGLGVSGVVPAGDHWVPLESEGGHASYGPLNAREQAIIEVMRERLEHVSAESLVSGRGLSLIYEVITRLDQGVGVKLTPGEVSQRALELECPVALETLSIFCNILGTIAGNLALTLGAQGGVYIGGGIILRILDFFSRSGFRERFEKHGRLTPYLRSIPTYVINTDYPALAGAVVALGEGYESVGVVSRDQA
ncbi:MAG: glucokinase [Gammaproteobacteria bacterium]|jgi:glucokinase|nr:glucokinase [Gammaproteobacteria bacterium]